MKKKKQIVSARWIYVAWLGLIVPILGFGIIGAIVQGDPEPLIKSTLGFSDTSIFALGLYSVGLLLALVVLRNKFKKHGVAWRKVGLRGKVTFFSVLCVGLALLFDALVLFPSMQWLSSQIGIPFFWNGSDTFVFGSNYEFAIAVLAVVIIAPIAEEIIFRGYLITALLHKGYRVPVAVILAAIIFASVHLFFGPGFVLYIILWALIPSFLFLKFKSLYPAILFHCLNNILAYLVLPVLHG